MKLSEDKLQRTLRRVAGALDKLVAAAEDMQRFSPDYSSERMDLARASNATLAALNSLGRIKLPRDAND